jgi:glycosyltransferase involved in cell wall biosynthesis
LKISLFISGLGNGGAERVFARLYKFIKKQGYEIELVSATDKGEMSGKLNCDVLCLNSRFALLSLLRYRAYLKKSKPDVVLATLSSSIIVAGLSRWLRLGSQHTLICRIANIYQKPSGLFEKVYRLTEKFALRKADCIISNSRATLRSIEDLIGKNCLENKYVTTISNPVLDDDYQSRIKKIQKEIKLGKDAEPENIVFIGRLVAQKQIDHAIKIFVKIQKINANARLTIIGDGTERTLADQLIEEFGIGGKVEFIKYCDDIPKMLVKSGCLINTSKFEGFGNVFIEGLAYCNNLVAYASDGGATELLGETNATLVDCGNIFKFAEAVVGGLGKATNKELATEHYLNNYTESYICSRYLEVIKLGYKH